MCSKVISLLLVIPLCSGERSPAYSGKHKASGQAVSSQMYHRYDVPLSYKFTSVHEPQIDTKNNDDKQYVTDTEDVEHPGLKFKKQVYRVRDQIPNNFSGKFHTLSIDAPTAQDTYRFGTPPKYKQLNAIVTRYKNHQNLALVPKSKKHHTYFVPQDSHDETVDHSYEPKYHKPTLLRKPFLHPESIPHIAHKIPGYLAERATSLLTKNPAAHFVPLSGLREPSSFSVFESGQKPVSHKIRELLPESQHSAQQLSTHQHYTQRHSAQQYTTPPDYDYTLPPMLPHIPFEQNEQRDHVISFTESPRVKLLENNLDMNNPDSVQGPKRNKDEHITYMYPVPRPARPYVEYRVAGH